MATERPRGDAACALCDLPLPTEPVENDAGDRFCCTGCRRVHATVDTVRGVERTDLRSAVAGEDPSTEDVPPDDHERAFFRVEGMHCVTCERFLEAIASDIDGVYDTNASYPTEVITVDYDPETVTYSAVPEQLSGFGYRVNDLGNGDRSEFLDWFAFDRYRTVIAALVMMPILALYLLFIYPTYLGIYPREFLFGPTVTTMVFVPLTVWSTIAVLGLGYPFFRGAVVSVRVRQPNMDVLIVMAVLAAYGYSVVSFVLLDARTVYFDVAVMILGVVTIGKHVENRLKWEAITNRADLTETGLTEARRLADDGSTEVIEPDECEPGDRLLIRPGERVPVDGTVVDGTAAVDESLMTGESVPQPKEPDDAVIGGSIVTDDALVVEAGPSASSTLEHLAELMWAAQSSDAGVQRHVNRFAVLFIPLVITIAVGTTIGWLVLGRPPGEALLIGVAVLVISCPCSLGIATPLALASGTGTASEAGIFVLNTAILERAPDSDIVVFDKTGTLTTGSMRVVGVDADNPDRLLHRAAAVEQRSSHPIGRAILAAADGETAGATDFTRHPRAVSATVAGDRVTVGDRATFTDEAWTIPADVETALDAAAESELAVLVGWAGRVRGIVRLQDTPREGWQGVLSGLDSDDRRVVVLTGDDQRMARPFAEHPAVDEVFAGVRPEAKEVIVRRLREEGTTTMVGDGTNDAAALAASDFGIGLASGTDIVMDAADAVVTTDDLRSIPTLFEVAAATRSRLRRNLGWAFAYNVLAVPLAVVGVVNPLIAALLMATSSLIVVTNSRRPLCQGIGRGD